MAAALLETLTVPRCSTLPPQSVAQASGSYFSNRRTVLGFSQFKGLKVQSTRLSVSLKSASKSARRVGRIVCEAQDTALDSENFVISYFIFSFLFILLVFNLF